MSAPVFGAKSWLAIGIALAVLLGLGTWQLQRKQWKDGLLAEIAARRVASPLTTLPSSAPENEYRRVRLTGSFGTGRAAHVFISVPRQASGIGGPGYWLFQEFTTGERSIYVNRGFVPEGEKSKSWGAPQNVTIEGIWRLPEPRNRFSNTNDAQKNIYFVRAPAEWDACIKCTTCKCVGPRIDGYVDMTGPTPDSGLPLPLVGKIAIPNRHLEYALTWYALAATLIGVVIAMVRRR